jgi:two-component system NtrC family sensor kinase
MTGRINTALKSIRPDFYRQRKEPLNPYFTFANYNKIWIIGILVLGLTTLVPLIAVTVIHYQLIQKSVDSELMLRTERVASNARRAVTFFMEERLNALRFISNEIQYAQLTDPVLLAEILRNLKLGFGGLSDLSVISPTGEQVAYAGPFKLEGINYRDQSWFIECRKHNYYVSEIFRGYRDVPHIIVAVKSYRTNGSFFILRATLETERLIQMLASYETGKHADIFLINRSGIIQTPSKNYGGTFDKASLHLPEYSPRTQVVITKDRQENFIISGYAFISTEIADTPFILMVIKEKGGMIAIWEELHSKINWIVGLGIMLILVAIIITCTFMVNKMFLADKAKAETLAMVEQNCQLASVGQLAAGVAHEINNPLALINETAGYIKDLFTITETYRHDEELLENIDSILEAVERCGRITRQLLGFARKFDIKIQKIDVKEVISDVLNFHNKESIYRNITVAVDMPEETLEIESDRGKLQQILLNLVNNAFQAVNEGCRLDISAKYQGIDKLVISIGDNGCGMPKEALPKIFEPFFTTKPLGKGTGLGLPITYGLVKKLNGEISVKSILNEGTTFTITLPIRLEEGRDDDESSASGR